ncbi:uncharacterized protein LOC127725216 isoform X4 [Mytilus californianus]|uniref:uncharacterized protein LOC127725216 isoform X4 n=1 Tax=Mytilus californianus TaxID=6549 RepID=UPI00224527D9|nr:uncharacterized protein LOC127725216 isoform X4 [Mytilus californianus]
MENISFRILRICIFVCSTELQNVQLLSGPEPCPDIAHSTTIADMCTTDFASEDSKNGGTTTDSVALRVMTKQDGCTCELSLQNQYKMHTVYMRKYDLLTSAAPEQEACGLAIDIDYTSPKTIPENKASIECTKGTNTRSVSLPQKGVIYLRSRTIGGNFVRGYCIQIYRHHITGGNVGIQINCSHPNKQTTQQDKNNSNTDSTLYIAIGVGSVVVVIALFVVVAIIIIRRKVNTNKDNTEVQPDTDCTDYDSDGLKYNTLYNASEQQDIMEGDYHTVDLERKQNRTGIQTFGGDYSAVDGNYSSIDIVNMPVKDGSKTNNKIKSTSTTTDRSETQRTEEETSNNLKHVTPMANSNVEYAVVDNRGTSDKKVKHVTAPNDSNVEYAVIDKKIQI